MESFESLSLHESLLKSLQKLGFNQPTPIQAAAIPVIATGKDLIGSAQTGTGKTGAFSIPTANYLIQNKQSIGLILAPTRELAQQIEMFWKQLTQFSPDLKCACLIGGDSFSNQVRSLSRRPRLIIATPGRLNDHLNRRTLKLNNASVLVLDEADRMLDMGFAPQLDQILKYLPQKRQTLLFSATWDASMNQLSQKYLKNPERLTVGEVSKAAPIIIQKAISTTAGQKNERLLQEVTARDGSMLIFARTQIRTDKLAKYLISFGIEAGRIHGGRSQSQRTSALNAFRKGQTKILVATDIAARGIDVADIAFVINYDLPQVPDDYIHRIGRTGRAGRTGEALSFLTPEDRLLWRGITRLLKQTGSDMPQVEEATDQKKKPVQHAQRAQAPAVVQQQTASVVVKPSPIKIKPQTIIQPSL